MRNLILKVPGALFFILALSFFLVGVVSASLDIDLSKGVKLFFHALSLLTYGVWMMSVLFYVSKEIKSEKNVLVVAALIGIYTVLLILEGFLEYSVLMFVLLLLLHIILTIVLFNKTAKLFYARSKWFLFIEFFVTILGMLNLTGEIQNHENEKSPNRKD